MNRVLVLFAVIAGGLGVMLLERSSMAAPKSQAVAFEQTSFIETVPVDEGRRLVVSGFLSAPLIEPTLRTTIRQVVLSQTFESTNDGCAITRVCVFRQVNPIGSDAIPAKYTVANVGEGASGNTKFDVQIVPALGKNWMNVQEFEDLSISVTLAE